MNLKQISPLYGAVFSAMSGDKTPTDSPDVARQKILGQYDRAMQEGMEKAMANIRRWQPGVGKMATIDSMVPSDCITTPQISPEITAPPPPARYQNSGKQSR